MYLTAGSAQGFGKNLQRFVEDGRGCGRFDASFSGTVSSRKLETQASLNADSGFYKM